MRKVLILGGATFATLLVTCFVWIQFPRVSDPQFVQQTVIDGQNYFAQGQVNALEKGKNGYLRPEFLPYWGRKGQEYVAKSPTELLVKGWNLYSTAAQAKTVDHRHLQVSKDSAYLKARQSFESLAPALESAFRSETFVAPETRFDYDTMTMNFIALRSCAQAMTGFAESEMAAGNTDRAASSLGSLFTLCQALQQKGPLINEMIVCAIASNATAETLALVTPKTQMSAQIWKALAGDILTSVPHKDRMFPLMVGEMSCAKLFFSGLRNNRQLSANSASNLGISTSGLYIPGVLAREERIFDNVHTRLLKGLQQTGSVSLNSADLNPTAIDYFLGQSGVMVQLMLPNMEGISQRLDLDRRLRTVTATVYAALAFRAEHGRLAKNLVELTSKYPLPEDNQSLGLEYKVKDSGATVHIPYGEAQRFLESTEEFPGLASWVRVENDGLSFQL